MSTLEIPSTWSLNGEHRVLHFDRDGGFDFEGDLAIAVVYEDDRAATTWIDRDGARKLRDHINVLLDEFQGKSATTVVNNFAVPEQPFVELIRLSLLRLAMYQAVTERAKVYAEAGYSPEANGDFEKLIGA